MEDFVAIQLMRWESCLAHAPDDISFQALSGDAVKLLVELASIAKTEDAWTGYLPRETIETRLRRKLDREFFELLSELQKLCLARAVLNTTLSTEHLDTFSMNSNNELRVDTLHNVSYDVKTIQEKEKKEEKKEKENARNSAETPDLISQSTEESASEEFDLEIEDVPPEERLFDIWEEVLGPIRGPRLIRTQKRLGCLRSLWREQLAHTKGENPYDVFRRILLSVKDSEYHMSTRHFQFPESLFKNSERRERWAVAAFDGRRPRTDEEGSILDGIVRNLV